MNPIIIRLGGVPEHFNLPIHLANENGAFADKGIDLHWVDCPGGTGQMTKALREDELDVCIALTEGVVADIIKGNPAKLISTYVTSPLIWGIHTGANNSLQKGDDTFTKQHAISRLGSGSHLMAIVNAHEQYVKIDQSQFTVINNLSGALDSLKSLETDVFYWEKFTTKPYVDAGQLRRIGEYPTPWPCFVIAATDKVLENQPDAIKSMLDVIQTSCTAFMKDSTMVSIVSKRYEIEERDAKAWYGMTQWANSSKIDSVMIDQVVSSLKSAGIIGDMDLPRMIWDNH
ncbi:MAG: ABC transporter substrate-binding protein [Cyclobacteriaceae bacterium]